MATAEGTNAPRWFWWRNILPVLAPVAGVSAGAVFAFPKLDGWWKTGTVALAVVIFVADQFVRQFVEHETTTHESRLETALQAERQSRADAIEEERNAYTVRVNYVLAPLAVDINVLASSGTTHRAEGALAVMMSGLAAALSLVGPDRARATIFERYGFGDDEVLRPHRLLAGVGYGGPARSVFSRRADDPQGCAVWESFDADRPRFCPDIDADPPVGFDPAVPREYKTFISVNINAGSRGVGLLTINAPHPGDLQKRDIETMQTIAAMLGTVLGLLDGQWPVSGE